LYNLQEGLEIYLFSKDSAVNVIKTKIIIFTMIITKYRAESPSRLNIEVGKQ